MQEKPVESNTRPKASLAAEAALVAVAADMGLSIALARILADQAGHMSDAKLWISYAARAALAIAFVVFLSLAFKRKIRDFGFTLGSTRAGMASCAISVAAAAALLAAGGVAWLALRSRFSLPELPPPYPWTRGIPYAWLGLSLIVAPLFEEFLYRGILYNPLEDRLGRAGAVLASGLVFQALHLSYGINWPHYFFGGMILAWVFAKSRSLLYPVALHAGWNAFTVLMDAARWYGWIGI